MESFSKGVLFGELKKNTYLCNNLNRLKVIQFFMDIQSVKQRFSIIGNDDKLNRAIDKAIRVAPTDISVLVTGESGVGKESIPKIIHFLSNRKHGKYIAVNCGAIPEGTIDSELFGHEKGAFTGATSTRSGYFEEASGGTIFLDEVGELPMTTQVRLLRVLENGEFIKVGSSVVQKTDVRIVAATNVDMNWAIKNNKFREDLYYRLSTVEINLPPLRERKDDIHLLFRKFAYDFSEKYKVPEIHLTESGIKALLKCRWSGNIRQLRNVAEQLSVLEKDREISGQILDNYLPKGDENLLPVTVLSDAKSPDFSTERDILYKVLFDMKNDLSDLKKLTRKLLEGNTSQDIRTENQALIQKIYGIGEDSLYKEESNKLFIIEQSPQKDQEKEKEHEHVVDPPSVSIRENERDMIEKALKRNKGRRKDAAIELGIAERTLYRKIKQYKLENIK